MAMIEETLRDLSRLAIILVAVALPVCLLLAHLYTQYRISHLGYRIAEVTREHRRLMEDNKKLRIEAAIQGRQGRLEAVARERFGLEPVSPEQVILIDAEPSKHARLEVEPAP